MIQECVLCGKLMYYIGFDGTKVEWVQCRNPNCLLPGNMQRYIKEDQDG
jgi:hypothetical protein